MIVLRYTLRVIDRHTPPQGGGLAVTLEEHRKGSTFPVVVKAEVRKVEDKWGQLRASVYDRDLAAYIPGSFLNELLDFLLAADSVPVTVKLEAESPCVKPKRKKKQ